MRDYMSAQGTFPEEKLRIYNKRKHRSEKGRQIIWQNCLNRLPSKT